MTRYDLAVIGAGSGGLVAAAAAAQFGRRVVLFEKGRMGGECLNTGCVPSKALLSAARRQADFVSAMAHVRATIAAIAPHDSAERMQGLGVTVIPAAARFVGPDTLEAAGQRYQARRIVIATGSHPALPPIEGLMDVPFLTNETLFDLPTCPAHLVIIGGGAVGVEMAQAFRRLGSAVTLIEAAQLLPREDAEARAVLRQALLDEGIRILEQAKIIRIRTTPAITLELAGETVEGSHLLVATGRAPNVAGLNLEAAGITATARGITVDAGLRTTNRKVYAIGDVSGGPAFTHVAGHQAGLVIRSALFGLPVRQRVQLIPRVIYTDPELAQAGLTAAEAPSTTVLVSPFASNDRAVADGDPRGFVKILAGPRGRILGVTIVGRNAGELLAPFVLAMENKLPLRALAQSLVAYPTRSGAWQAAAVSSFRHLAASRALRWFIGLVGRFG